MLVMKRFLLPSLCITFGLLVAPTAFADSVIDSFTGAHNDDGSGCYRQTAQTWTTTMPYTLSGVVLKLARFGTPIADNTLISIYDTASGVPTGSPLTDQTIDTSAITAYTSDEAVTVNFTTPVHVDGGHLYAIVCEDLAHDGDNETVWSRSTDGYAGGGAYHNPGWASDGSTDLLFQTLGVASSTPSSGGASLTDVLASTNAETFWIIFLGGLFIFLACFKIATDFFV